MTIHLNTINNFYFNSIKILFICAGKCIFKEIKVIVKSLVIKKKTIKIIQVNDLKYNLDS